MKTAPKADFRVGEAAGPETWAKKHCELEKQPWPRQGEKRKISGGDKPAKVCGKICRNMRAKYIRCIECIVLSLKNQSFFFQLARHAKIQCFGPASRKQRETTKKSINSGGCVLPACSGPGRRPPLQSAKKRGVIRGRPPPWLMSKIK
jgi:hypothetical protein